MVLQGIPASIKIDGTGADPGEDESDDDDIYASSCDEEDNNIMGMACHTHTFMLSLFSLHALFFTVLASPLSLLTCFSLQP